MFLIVPAVMAFLLLYLYYKFSYKPRTLIKHYERLLKGLGYRVYVQPFQVFSISFAEVNQKNV